MKTPAIVLALLLLASVVCFGQRYRTDAAAKMNVLSKIREYGSQKSINQGMFDVKYYGLDIRIDPSSRTVSGLVTVTAKVVGDSISQMDLNLTQNMSVQQVTISGDPVSFIRPANMLSISLNRTYTKGEVVSASILYGGTPIDNFYFNTWNGQPMIWNISEPYGARNWWPCKDYPSDKADSADIRVRVPSTLIVASNGTLRAVLDSGATKTYCWAERYPIASYLISVAIHPYTTSSDYYKYSPSDSMEVKYYVLPGHGTQAQPYNAKTVNMIRIFSEMFGEYPFIKEKYGHAEALTGWASMEHQTCTTLSEWDEWTIAHELSHQWWGDLITCQDFHHIWLNEGFATYSADLYLEKVYGRQFFVNELLRYAYYGGGTIYVYDTTNVALIFSGNLSYIKGEWVLHMLRHVVGDSIFFTILRTYYADKRYQYGTATTENFRDVCEQVSGKNLHQFFQQWIYGEKYPSYLYTWSAVPDTDGGYIVPISLRQTTGTTNPAFFQMPIDCRLKGGAWDTTVVLLNDSQDQIFRVHTSHRPDTVDLDPDNWILRDVRLMPQGKPYITVDARTVDLGRISNTLLHRDTTFFVRNIGFAPDSVAISIDPGNVAPDTALAVFPAAFVLAPSDSQSVKFSIRSNLLVPSYYSAAITVEPRSGVGQALLTKAFIFQIVITGGIAEAAGLPTEITLWQCYPNPFNPSTTIKYDLPRTAHVTLTVFDPLGREVSVLVNEERHSGYHEVEFNASGLSSGVYLYQLRAGDFVSTKKMLIVK